MNEVTWMAALYMVAALGIMLLQAFLSGRERFWLGLILPILFFVISFLYPLNMAVPETGITLDDGIRLFLSWLMGNIPTIITLGIFFIARKEKKNK